MFSKSRTKKKKKTYVMFLRYQKSRTLAKRGESQADREEQDPVHREPHRWRTAWGNAGDGGTAGLLETRASRSKEKAPNHKGVGMGLVSWMQ